MFKYYYDYKDLTLEELKRKLAWLKFETGRFEKINKNLQKRNKDLNIAEHIGVDQDAIKMIEEFIRRKTK